MAQNKTSRKMKRKQARKTKGAKQARKLFERIGQEEKQTLRDLFADLLAAGMARKDAIEVLVEGLDNLIDFDELIPNPVGEALEAVDAVLFRVVITMIVTFVRARPIPGGISA